MDKRLIRGDKRLKKIQIYFTDQTGKADCVGGPLITANDTLMMEKENKEYLGGEGYALMGAAFEVHSELNGGLSEEIYQESLEWELGLRNIPYQTKAELKVYYKGHLLNKRYIPDLHIYGELLAELKAVKELTSEHEQQLLNYMHITKKAVGYLINFGPMKQLEWKRYILKEYIPDSH